ncbi:hypothetical protein ACJRO7_015164 [Eucalyptus globulus]|uniref:Uncharacterized protein n=1 Tax=Eucalyptus globulus TaxID=34317 RepID=A0ABD3L8C3_EUCGL
MKTKLLVWLFFIVSAQTILILAVECFSEPSNSTENTQGPKVPASYAGLNKTNKSSENADGRLVNSIMRKGSKGKRSVGGWDGRGARVATAAAVALILEENKLPCWES